ncbi:uncharacterized protein LOC130899655 [Diorhabda carinulata]|uniref:uncharacterized protein LOC130899655 n=1 Tax=Diorhabda carinulata TaxID=1163345 RepID=UPI0025A2ADB1|nr:uncharacterized protein LOC130899655 [Diorhabda carinulata]
MKLLVSFLVVVCWQSSSKCVAKLLEADKFSPTDILKGLSHLDTHFQNSTNKLLNTHFNTVNDKVNYVNERLTGIAANNYTNQEIIQKCITKKKLSEIQANEINSQIKRCATVIQAQYVNVMSTSYNDVQVFVSFATVIWNNIKKCGLNDSCRWQIVLDTINETGQLPSKVFSLAAKIQALVLETIIAINSCAIDGLKKVNAATLDATEQIFNCIAKETSNNSCSYLT